MPRKKSQDPNRQVEALNSKVDLTGAGEDPAVKALLSDDFITAPNSEAFDVALMLQQIIRGQTALLENQDVLGKQLADMRGRMDKYDEDAAKWEDNRQKFLEDTTDKAESLRIKDPDELARFQAKQAQVIQAEMRSAVANNAVDKLQFDTILENQEKIMITSPGIPVTRMIGGVPQMMMEPEVIRIRHRTWVLTPGVPVMVPKLVADEYAQRLKDRNEQNQRKAILNADRPLDNVKMAAEWNKINKGSNPNAEAMPFDDR